MKYRVLGRTGLRVSELGVGGHEYRRPLPTTLRRWGEIDLPVFMAKQPKRNKFIGKAIASGVNYFDATQPEEAKSLGIALKESRSREDVYVALMILEPLNQLVGKPPGDWRRIIAEDVEKKLRLLQSSYTDILTVHTPEVGYSRERLVATIESLNEFKDEGKIGWIAASSHEPGFLAELIRAYDCFDSVMVRYNYFRQDARESLFPLCKAREVGVVVMKPLSWPYYGIPFTFFRPDDELESCKPAQTSLRWILESMEVSTVVAGMNDEEELEENIEAVERDGEIDEGILNRYLEVATGSGAKETLEKMLNDPSIDIRYFAQNALKNLQKIGNN
jgi:aryl-alcohol dehydrogenase-like predicted oxidoreductase